jgi:hypothetical protein
VGVSFCLSVCLSVCLSACLSVCLSVYLSVFLHVCLSVCLSRYVCMSPNVRIPREQIWGHSPCLSFFFTSVRLSVCNVRLPWAQVWGHSLHVRDNSADVGGGVCVPHPTQWTSRSSLGRRSRGYVTKFAPHKAVKIVA